MKTPFQDKRILLGISGSIACYKSIDLASKLTQAGAEVDVILTQAASQFVSPLTFQSVTGRPAYTDIELWGAEGHVLHIGLGKDADLFAIAPVTANSLAKLALGSADNLLSITALAISCPLLLAPAMDGEMFHHPATQANLETLRQRGAIIIGPEEGHLASGMSGVGRMTEPVELLGHIRWILARGGPLSGQKVVVTAGATQEPVDPVRLFTNRSSGKQGFALAQAALDLGAEVTLVSGPTTLPTPVGVHRVDVNTAAEMLGAVLQATTSADALLMAAAVADFRPTSPATEKLKKATGAPVIHLEATADILDAVNQQKARSQSPRVVVGFAAESHQLLENAQGKLHAKQLDLIVANNIRATNAGFAVDTNQVTLLFPDGRVEELPLMSKAAVAEIVLAHTMHLLLGQD